MFINLSPKARIYISKEQLKFLHEYSKNDFFLQSKLSVEEVKIAKVLADKGMLVRKKLTSDTQFAVNRRIRIPQYGNEK